MDKDQNFDPYIDWSGITQEMVDDFHGTMVKFRKASDQFLEKPNKEDLAAVLRTQSDLSSNFHAIMATLYTVPAMVHVAGERVQEELEDGRHEYQRCTRCGSTLAYWRSGLMTRTSEGETEITEDNIAWWEPGDVVAKAIVQDVGGELYLVSNRELEPHEKFCPDLSGLTA
jgi:hypothetical protein